MAFYSLLAQAATLDTDPESVVTLTPTANSDFIGLPVANALIAGIGKYALLAALVGLLISAGLWAIGAHSQNFSQTYNGKKGVAVSAGAALIIGAAAFIVNFFFATGQGFNNAG